MDTVANMSQIFEKLNDLKAVFVYGERLIPIIQSLIDFMKDTVPLLENINYSIADSTSKIPKVTNQINNVTNATELATTEILDTVDSLNKDLTVIEKTMQEVLTKENDKKDFLLSIIPLLNKENAAEFVEDFINKNSSSEKLSDLLTQVGKMKNDANNITISLQVQDITAQQLAAVTHLIESVQSRLSSLIVDLEHSDMKHVENLEIKVEEGVAFDPNARYTKSTEIQETVDSIINSEVLNASQAEIDKLFS